MIDKFMGPTRWLSNFHECEIEFEGRKYPSVEHAYMAAKSLDENDREYLSTSGIRPAAAKRFGMTVKLRPDWELPYEGYPALKLYVMETLNRQKFTRHQDLRDGLIATGSEELVEGNTWGDTYWGVCRGKGENHLGKILMKIRAELTGFTKIAESSSPEKS